MKKILDGIFMILKIMSWLFIALILLTAFTVTFTDGQYNLGARILMIVMFNTVPVIFLVWRSRRDKEKRVEKRRLKLERQLERKKEEQAIKEQLEEIEKVEKSKLEMKKQEINEKINLANNEAEIRDNKKIYRFGEERKGSMAATVIIDENWMHITQTGVLNKLNRGLNGSKKIFIKNISAVQIKEATNITSGYIQFVIKGSQESKAGILAATKDENSIMFQSENNELAKKMAREIELIIEKSHNSQTIIKQETMSVAQQLREFKELLDSEIITQEEFDKKKSELLK